MKANEQTNLQVERFLNKIAQKFPEQKEATLLTDIHVRVSQESGELKAFDDDGNEVTRCVIEQWIDDKDEGFNVEATAYLRDSLKRHHALADNLGILKPYSFVLEDEDGAHIAELYVADDDTMLLGGDLMEGLDKDLDSFFDEIMKED